MNLLGYTVTSLSEATHINKGTISRWSHGGAVDDTNIYKLKHYIYGKHIGIDRAIDLIIWEIENVKRGNECHN